jgi:glutamyl-tRNA synthetase
VHKGGAKFDFEKAKWFNHEWIKHQAVELLMPDVKQCLAEANIDIVNDDYLAKVISLVKDRCTLISDFNTQSIYFFEAPKVIDLDALKPKWSEEKAMFFKTIQSVFNNTTEWQTADIETAFKQLATEMNIKVGELQLPFRIMLVGGKFGPGVFQIAEMIGKENTLERIQYVLTLL